MITAAEETEGAGIPRLPVGDWIETGFDWINENLSALFGLIRTVVTTLADWLTTLLTTPDALILAVLLSLLGWLVKDWKLGLLSLAMLVFVISIDQWDNAMLTLTLVLISAGAALLLAIPLGILAARSRRVSGFVRPVMDLMQTMPAFVWLVPVVTLFSIGITAGVIATVIFCLPPGVRFTELGIRQVDTEVVEAGYAFGSTPWQILRGIQVPLALPTIMAGVNQVIMLALSMAVIAGLVGAGGLGGAVTSAIGSLDIGLGFEAGLSVVALAIYLDRLTAAVGASGPGQGLFATLRRRRGPAKKATAEPEASTTSEPAPAP